MSISSRGGAGGSAGSRRAYGRRGYFKRRQDGGKVKTESESTNQLKENRADEPTAQKAEQARIGGDEPSQQERERGQGDRGGGASNCSTCGTLLPEAQANACPVCAQSGPDVMALTSIHYRAGGAKFLATVDLFNASDDARELIVSGAAPSVISLRYEQDIPGHKDFLKFKVSQ